uniref:Uncharacterized protein n=1 Tax=Rhizophora mucronata TaxID=61149 RepID=A0A2P2NWU2_RHIMU
MSVNGSTMSVPRPPYSLFKKSLNISEQTSTTLSRSSPNVSLSCDSFLNSSVANFCVSSCANSGIGSR